MEYKILMSTLLLNFALVSNSLFAQSVPQMHRVNANTYTLTQAAQNHSVSATIQNNNTFPITCVADILTSECTEIALSKDCSWHNTIVFRNIPASSSETGVNSEFLGEFLNVVVGACWSTN